MMRSKSLDKTRDSEKESFRDTNEKNSELSDSVLDTSLLPDVE